MVSLCVTQFNSMIWFPFWPYFCPCLYPVHLPNYRVLKLGLVPSRGEISTRIFQYLVVLSNNNIGINNSIYALYWYLIFSTIKSFRMKTLLILSDRSSLILQSSTISKAHALLIASHNSQVLKNMETGNNLPHVHVKFCAILFEIKEWILTWCYCKQERINITVFPELLLPETLLVPLNKLVFLFLSQLFLQDLPASSPISTSFKTTWLLIWRNWCLLKVSTVFNYDNIYVGKRWNQS